MSARTGAEFTAGLQDEREVWVGGERIRDVTNYPGFAGSIAGMAGYFDWQHTHASECLVLDDESGERIGASHLIPQSRTDLDRRHACFERIAHYSMGMLGRTPDYVNCTFAGFAGRADVLKGKEGENAEGAHNLVRYQREIALRDLSLTHCIIHPVVDKTLGDVDGVNGELALQKVGETENGIVVRGARILATLGPFADEMAVYPGQPLPQEAGDYALCFCIPLSTPGLKILCRDHYQAGDTAFDRPFSSRFDEQDTFVIFDDVEIPRERVFVDGNVSVYNRMMLATGWVGNIMQQTAIRSRVKLAFAYELCTRMADALNSQTPPVHQMLGELWSYAELTRATISAAEAGASARNGGTWICDEAPFRALRPTMPGWMTRAVEIVKLIGGHNLLATPSRAALDNPQLRPFLDTYLRGAGSTTAEQRAVLFRTAWDFAGSALGSRTELYERFYLASAARMYQVAHVSAQRDERWHLVPDLWEALGTTPRSGDG